MNMTKQEAIENHRKLWSWLADTAEKENRVVEKEEYFCEFKLPFIENDCCCCEYTLQFDTKHDGFFVMCSHCPVMWKSNNRTNEFMCEKGGEYSEWKEALFRKDVPEFIRLARIIANLPEREDTEA